MKYLKLNIKQFFNRKWLSPFLFFLVLSTVFLLLTKLSKVYVKEFTIKVSAANVPEHHILKTVDTSITVTVKGLGYRMIPLLLKNRELLVDVQTKMNQFQGYYLWHSKPVAMDLKNTIGSYLEIETVAQDSILFNYNTLARKKVPIKFGGQVSYAVGFDSNDEASIFPDSTYIIGSKESIDKIKEVSTKSEIFENIKTDINLKIALISPDNDVKTEINEVDFTITVNRFTEGIYSVPVEFINVPDGLSINYFPKSVDVSYYVSLTDFKTIKKEDFAIQCDYNELSRYRNNEVIARLIKEPSFVKFSKLKTNKINVIIN